MDQKYNYVLIIDEVPDVIQPFVYDPYMIRELEQMEKISVDGETGIISWISPTKKGFGVDIMNLCKSGRLMYNKAADAVYLIYPFDLFCAFTDVYISTYMFDAQPVGYYFKYYGFEYDEWIPLPAVDQCGDIVPGKYELVPKTEDASVNAGMHYDKLIHICDNEKMNAIGNSRTALSTTWYLKVGNNSNEIKTLKKNMKNFFRNIHGSPAGNNLWTVVKSSEKVLRGDGYSSNCFISMTARGTNEYSNRHCVAYMANRFMNPYLKRFFASVDIKVDEDRFALSEMLQVIWRSAIRNGEEIQVYIPSKRMRTLLEKWIADHSYGNNDISSHQKNGNAVKLGNGKEKNKQIQKRPRQRGWHVEN